MAKTPKRIRPYDGDEPYIFVSYSHRNEQAALRILRTLLENGFRVWYDEAINPGTDWANVIADHIRNCGCFLSLLSPEYVESENCQAEINYAIKHKRNSLPVYLAPTELPSGIDMYLSRFQAVFADSYEDEREFFEKLFLARGIERFRDAPSSKKPTPDAATPKRVTAKKTAAATKPPRKNTPRMTEEGDEAMPVLWKKTTRAAKNGKPLRFEDVIATAEAIPEAVDGEPGAAQGQPEKMPAQTASQPPQTTRAAGEAPLPVASHAEETAEGGATQYLFPSLTLLKKGKPMPPEDEEELIACVKGITEVLGTSKIKIVGDITYSRGPTVTRYEMELDPGTRLPLLKRLSDELTLALGARSGVRIVAPIPGTKSIGIEVPNRKRHVVCLRDLLESPAFLQSNDPLTAALGVNISGDPTVFDLAKMPHLLIGGQTGSGKTVGMQCILASLLYRNRPEDLRLVLIDPKSVEFGAYKRLPHLLTPVITRPLDAVSVLRALVEEMNRRFDIFMAIGVRDINRYNELLAKGNELKGLPRIVVAIDELADLMLVARADVETAICSLAQKARAAGIHLLLGTQRMSVDVIPGVIKANIPSVIAYRVRTYNESRLLLDGEGADKLAGAGDLIFRPVGAMSGERVQGAFVDDTEIEALCEQIRRANGTTVYDERIANRLCELTALARSDRKRANAPAFSNMDADDSLYIEAVRFVIALGEASVALLQRKFSIGYARAARLVDRMTDEGVISEPNGSRPRSVLLTFSQFLEHLLG